MTSNVCFCSDWRMRTWWRGKFIGAEFEGTNLWHHFLFAMVWNAYHTREIITLHTKAIFKKWTTSVLSNKQINFLKALIWSCLYSCKTVPRCGSENKIRSTANSWQSNAEVTMQWKWYSYNNTSVCFSYVYAIAISMSTHKFIWAASWQNQQNSMSARQRLRSAWASAHSDQSSLSA